MIQPLEKPQKLKLKKVLTVANVLAQKVVRLAFTGEWFEAFKKPQDRGMWFVWGTSGSGKSTFLMMLAKAFALLDLKVLYNLLEEETDDTDFIDRVELCGMNEVDGMFETVSYTLEELDYYLAKKTTRVKVVFIDSATYMTRSFEDVKALVKRHKNLIFVFSGHAEGKNPRTDFEKSLRFHAKMKIYIDGFLASCQGRTVGPNGGRFIIYKDGFEKINGVNPKLN